MSGYLYKYPDIARAVETIAPKLTEDFKRRGVTGKYELEARFGKVTMSPSKSAHGTQNGQSTQNTHFTAGVTEDFFKTAVAMTQACKEWKQVKSSVETHDYFYTVDGRTVRTTVTFTEDNKSIATTHCVKEKVWSQDFRVVFGANAHGKNGTVPLFDVRVALHVETDMRADALPKIVNPTWVRIKQRKTFLYSSPGSVASSTSVPCVSSSAFSASSASKGGASDSGLAAAQSTPETATAMWSFDFTRSWSAPSREEAEQKQKLGVPVYEIECECRDPLLYLKQPRHDETFLSTSLLLKMKDFFDFGEPSAAGLYTFQPC